MPETVDFYYATVAWERGFAATAEAHFSGTLVYSLEQFLQKIGVVGLEQRENYLNNQMQQEIEGLYSDMERPSFGTGLNVNGEFRAKGVETGEKTVEVVKEEAKKPEEVKNTDEKKP